jgi:hypothetical protein
MGEEGLEDYNKGDRIHLLVMAGPRPKEVRKVTRATATCISRGDCVGDTLSFRGPAGK